MFLLFDSKVVESHITKKKLHLNYLRETLSPCRLFSAESAARRCSEKTVFLKISQDSQENTCTGVSFYIKLQAFSQVFSCEFCEIFKNTFFHKTPPVWLLLAVFNKGLYVHTTWNASVRVIYFLPSE